MQLIIRDNLGEHQLKSCPSGPPRHYVGIIWLLVLMSSLMSCGGTNPSANDSMLVSSLSFSDPVLQNCVLTSGAERIKDLVNLSCLVEEGSGMTFSDTTGLGQLTALTSLTLKGQFERLNISNNPYLTHLSVKSRNLAAIIGGADHPLADLTIGYGLSAPIDLSEFKHLDSLTVRGDMLEFLEVRNDTITTLNITEYDGMDLRYLTSLLKLTINSSNIKILDFSNFPRLETLDIQEFWQSTSLNLIGTTSLKSLTLKNIFLTHLNLSDQTNLEFLEASNFYQYLETITLADNNSLTTLIANSHSLKEINLAGSVQLKHLELRGNQLTQLDLSNNTKLNYLDLQDNLLHSLELSKSTKLQSIQLKNNLLHEPDLPNLSALQSLDLRENPLVCDSLHSITSLYSNIGDFKVDARAEFLCASNALFFDPQLASCVASTNKTVEQIKALHCINDINTTAGIELLTSLESLDISGGFNSVNLKATNKLKWLKLDAPNLHGIDLAHSPDLEYLELSDSNLLTLDLSQNINLKSLLLTKTVLNELDLSNNTLLSSLSLNTQISHLDISNLTIPKLSLDANRALTSLTARDTQITELSTWGPLTTIDLRGSTLLESLDLRGYSNFLSLDLTDQSNLKQVYLTSFAMDSLNCPSQSTLTNLMLDNVTLESLDLRACTNLTNLSLYGTRPTIVMNVNVWFMPKAFHLPEFNNIHSLTLMNLADEQLDLSEFSALQEVNIGESQIKNLAFPSSLDLKTVTLSGPSIERVNLTSNTKLAFLKIYNATLESIDVGSNPALETLDLSYDKLTALNLSSNALLESLHLSGNPIESLDVSQNVNLELLVMEDHALNCENQRELADRLDSYGTRYFLGTCSDE